MAGGIPPPKGASKSGSFDETIDFIIGAPPIGAVDLAGSTLKELTGNQTFNRSPQQKVINNAMPIVHIQPGIPSLTKGIDLMSRTPAMSASSDTITASDVARTGKRGSYVEQLAKLGFHLKQGSPAIPGFLSCNYLADNFPTDTFTNEYGENFLQKFTDVASEGASSIAQIMGATSASEAYKTITKNLEASEGAAGKAAGKNR